MVISIPEILTTESSGKYIMSIRLMPGGLSFTGYDPEDEQTFFTRTIESDATMPYLTFVKEVFFANEWLTFPFKQVNIVFTDAPFVLVPEALYDESKKDELFSFVYTSPAEVCLVNKLEDGAKLIFGVGQELYEFCSRSVIQPHFYHRLTPLLSLWKKQSSVELVPQMYAVFYRKKMFVICYNQGKISFLNTFEGDTENERLYFVMSVWKNLNLNQLSDQLHILCDDKDESSRMRVAFSVYLRNVKEEDLRSEFKMREINPADFPVEEITLAL